MIRISLASPADFEEIDRLIHLAYSHDYGPSEQSGDPMRTAAERAKHFDVWAAHNEENELVGTVTTRRAGAAGLHEDALEHELDLRLLAVSPSARRQGVAARLMQFVSEQAAATGYTSVFFKTAPNMVSAQRLYAAIGYDRVPERDGLWIGGHNVRDLFSYVRPVGAET